MCRGLIGDDVDFQPTAEDLREDLGGVANHPDR